MLQVAVRHLGKELDIKSDYEDVKGILAGFEIPTRPFEAEQEEIESR